jgi:CubicO group peptidase (beta-lactamase class C family)
MRFLKKILKWIFIVLVAVNIAIIAAGKTYLYKGIYNTYMKGRSGPAVDEYKIFNNYKIETAAAQPWHRAKNYNQTKIPARYLTEIEKIQTIAFLVIKNDSIMHEQYWDEFSDTSHTNSFSMAKTFVSVLTGIAIADGKIKRVDEPIANYISEYNTDKKNKITIKHLLTMSSGINFDEDYVNPFAYPAAAYYGSNLKKLTLTYNTKHEPGKYFEYLSGNTVLLAMVIEKAVGMSISKYAEEKLWKKMGAENAAYWSLDDKGGMEKSYCCFNSNARDFARFGKLYLDSGRWNGEQLVPQDFVLHSIVPADLLKKDGTKNNKYGYSWWLMPNYKGHRVFYARGILGQYIIVLPNEKLIIVRLGKKRVSNSGDDHPQDLTWYIDAALEMCK